MGKMSLGLAIAAVSLSLALFGATELPRQSWRSQVPFLLTCVLYGVMMFASSYVEEEQQFWYWATSAWMVVLMTKRYRTLCMHLQRVALTTHAVSAAAKATYSKAAHTS